MTDGRGVRKDETVPGLSSRTLAAAIAAVVVVASAAAGSGAVGLDRADAARTMAATAPILAPHLPTAVNAPGTWSSEEGVTGPVAAVGIAMRTTPEGLFDERERLALFGVAALDGAASWLDLPGFSLERSGLVGGVSVSPDGRWIGWIRELPPGPQDQARVAGWSVLDTTTGDIRRLDVPDEPWVGATAADLAFSGDSRYLLTSYGVPERAGLRDHTFLAWDVRTGTPTVVERPGHYWLPNVGLAPSTVTWARSRTVFRFDPATGRRSSVRLPDNVVVASWGPDDSAFAYVGRPSINSGRWRLHVGRTAAAAARTVADLPAHVVPSEVLGWRDPGHVVVGHYRTVVHVVDVDTGAVEDLDLAGYGRQMNVPSLASGLWSEPLAAPAEPQGTTDPRKPWRRTGGVVGSAAALAALAGLVRRRRRGPPERPMAS